MTTLLASIRKERDARAAKAAKTYREIVWRADKPKKGDTQALADAMATLGIDEAAVAADIEATREYAHLKAEAAALPERRKAAQEARDAQARAKARLEEAQRAFNESCPACGVADGAVQKCVSAAAALEELPNRHPAIFGDGAPTR